MAVSGADAFNDVHVLVMAGGSGTRFWPRSRVQKPKQLLALWDEKTLLEHTIQRFARAVPHDHIWIVTSERLIGASREILGPKYADVRFLGEPVSQNTAPCILWGIHEIRKVSPDAVVAVMPADSYIGNEKALLDALAFAIAHARKEKALVTLGVRPNRPETGYGYIEVERTTSGATPVLQFVEKPDLRTALRYVESGRYLWNAGMFLFTVDTGVNAFRKTMPALSELFESKRTPQEIYSKIEKKDAVSVDYGVMECATDHGIPVAVVPTDCGWNDVGSFTALEDIECATRGEVITQNAQCNVVQTDRGIVALLGVSDLVVVRDGDVVLVCSKEQAQNIKGLVEKVKKIHPELV